VDRNVAAEIPALKPEWPAHRRYKNLHSRPRWSGPRTSRCDTLGHLGEPRRELVVRRPLPTRREWSSKVGRSTPTGRAQRVPRSMGQWRASQWPRAIRPAQQSADRSLERCSVRLNPLPRSATGRSGPSPGVSAGQPLRVVFRERSRSSAAGAPNETFKSLSG
jgi:hypothetical protein